MFDFQSLLTLAGVDSLLICNPSNVRYLSGFSVPRDAHIIVGATGPLLVVDARYNTQAAAESTIPVHIAERSKGDVSFADGRFSQKPTLEQSFIHNATLEGKIGYEALHLSVSVLDFLSNGNRQNWVPTFGLVESKRIIKTPSELGLIRKAAHLTDLGFAHILKNIKAGMTEAEVALELEIFLRNKGADELAFDTTVASGVRGAMPHGGATQKIIQEGELVTLDFGAKISGYHSDMTRTIAVGKISEKLQDIYNTVLGAQISATHAVEPGVQGRDVDKAAREFISNKGYGEFFSHSTGHGVGLDIHEQPNASIISEQILQSGMTLTVEPGIYIPDVGGVRIEDLLVVAPGGFENLCHSPKELITV